MGPDVPKVTVILTSVAFIHMTEKWDWYDGRVPRIDGKRAVVTGAAPGLGAIYRQSPLRSSLRTENLKGQNHGREDRLLCARSRHFRPFS